MNKLFLKNFPQKNYLPRKFVSLHTCHSAFIKIDKIKGFRV